MLFRVYRVERDLAEHTRRDEVRHDRQRGMYATRIPAAVAVAACDVPYSVPATSNPAREGSARCLTPCQPRSASLASSGVQCRLMAHVPAPRQIPVISLRIAQPHRSGAAAQGLRYWDQ